MVDSEQATSGAHRIVLECFPSRLFTAAEEQWEALLREYALRSLGGAHQSFDADEVNRGREALNLMAEAVTATDQTAEPTTVVLSVSQPGDFGVLQAVLHDARRLSLAGELLMIPTLPEFAVLRNWLCEEVPAQCAGAIPTPWVSGEIADDPDGPPPVEWDDDFLPPQDVAWVVGDDHNRIVAASPAALELLGWAEDLVGQRLLSMIPPQLREAHLAGFSRSVVSGEGALLGVPLALPALRADGSEVPVTLTLARHAARQGRHVYLGVLAPRA